MLNMEIMIVLIIKKIVNFLTIKVKKMVNFITIMVNFIMKLVNFILIIMMVICQNFITIKINALYFTIMIVVRCQISLAYLTDPLLYSTLMKEITIVHFIGVHYKIITKIKI